MNVLKCHDAVFCRIGAEASSVLAAIEQESNTPPWSQNLFESEFNNECASILGARIDGLIAGFLIYHVVSNEAHIVNVAVRSSYRKRGLGRGLLQFCLEDLFARRVQWVTLEVRRSNYRARNLYEGEGFSEMSIRERYYSDNGEDALLLRLNVEHWKSSIGSNDFDYDGVPPIIRPRRLTMNDS